MQTWKNIRQIPIWTFFGFVSVFNKSCFKQDFMELLLYKQKCELAFMHREGEFTKLSERGPLCLRKLGSPTKTQCSATEDNDCVGLLFHFPCSLGAGTVRLRIVWGFQSLTTRAFSIKSAKSLQPDFLIFFFSLVCKMMRTEGNFAQLQSLKGNRKGMQTSFVGEQHSPEVRRHQSQLSSSWGWTQRKGPALSGSWEAYIWVALSELRRGQISRLWENTEALVIHVTRFR